jgi:hypothetical protein
VARYQLADGNATIGHCFVSADLGVRSNLPFTSLADTNPSVTVSVPIFLSSAVKRSPLTLNVPFFETLTKAMVNDLIPAKPPQVFNWHLTASLAEKSPSCVALTALNASFGLVAAGVAYMSSAIGSAARCLG